MRYRDIEIILAVVLSLSLLQGVAATARAVEPSPFIPVIHHYSTMSYSRGVRNIGMGATGTADIKGFPTGFFNPASFAWADAITLGGSYQEWILDIKLTDTRISGGGQLRPHQSGSGWRLGGSIGYSNMSMEPKVERVIFLPEGTGRTFNLDDYYISGSGAIAWEREHLSVGVGGTAKYLNEIRGDGDISAWAFDVGVIAAIPLSWNDYQFQPRSGVAVTNLSEGISYSDDLEGEIIGEQRWALGFDVASPPLAVGSGMWRRDVSVLSFSVNYDNIHRSNAGSDGTRWAVGWEVSLLELIQARYGVNNNTFSSDEKANTLGFGLGWDFGRLLFQVDYAHISANVGISEPLDEHVFGVLVGGRL